MTYPRVALVLIVLPLLLAAIAVDALALRPPTTPQPLPPRLSGVLHVGRLADGTLLISQRDYEAGIYPIGRRFVPALP